MIILKNPEQARAMGLISAKAQLTVGTAEWQTFLAVLSQGTAIGGAVLFALITSWVFGREFSDHTIKELLALPTSRVSIVLAKFVLIALWVLALVLFVFAVGLGVGSAVDIPGWSSALLWSSFWKLLIAAFLTYLLMPLVALFASYGRGFLPPMGWTILTLLFANILSLFGWGDWFPWSVPVLVSGIAGQNADQVGLHSYLVVILAFLIGLFATLAWWQRADQTR